VLRGDGVRVEAPGVTLSTSPDTSWIRCMMSQPLRLPELSSRRIEEFERSLFEQVSRLFVHRRSSSQSIGRAGV
jgi:hypothetical protein